METADVLVVGAGLAGLHTATTGRERFEGGGESQFDETTVTGHLRETRSSMITTAFAMFWMPCATTTPNSVRCERIALTVMVC